MVRGKRRIMAAFGLLAALAIASALSACNGYNPKADGYGAAEPAPTATPSPAAAAPDNQNQNAAPVGIVTDKLTAISIPKMGKVVADAKGWALYRFDADKANPSASNCADKCAEIWPPVLVDGTPQVEGVDPALVGTITRADGGTQVTLAGWPLYRYIGDPKPGAWKGQGVNGKWFVAAPTGKKNLTCVPTGTPTPVQPAAAAPEPSSGGSGY